MGLFQVVHSIISTGIFALTISEKDSMNRSVKISYCSVRYASDVKTEDSLNVLQINQTFETDYNVCCW